MAKELTIVLRAKNAMSAGLSRARAGLNKLGGAAVKAGKIIGTSLLAAGAAAVAFATKALGAYAVQEKAVASLSASFAAYGEEATINTEKIKALAAAIQDETGAADEQTIATAAQLKTLGVSTAKLEEAVKGTIALKSAGLDGASASRALANAMQGNYEMLNRYIPALKGASTEEEKSLALKDFLARGYEQQKAQLDTVAGRWTALKGRVGDAWEEIGAAIAGNDTIKNALDQAGEKVKEFGAAIKEWVDSGGVERFRGSFLFALEEVKFSILSAKIAWNEFTGKDGVDDPGIWSRFRDTAGAAIAGLVVNFQYALEKAKQFKAFITGGDYTPTINFDDVLAQQGVLWKTITGKYDEDRSKLSKTQSEKEALTAEHNARILEIEQQTIDAIEAQRVNRIKRENERRAASVSIAEEAADDITGIEEEKVSAIESINNDRLGAEISAVDDIVSANEDGADSVADVWSNRVTRIKGDLDDLRNAASDSIPDAGESSSRSLSGGSFERTSSGAGNPAGIANGTRFVTNTSGLSFTGASGVNVGTSSDALLRNMNETLRGIRTDNQTLLRVG